jgi:hypothetical protein
MAINSRTLAMITFVILVVTVTAVRNGNRVKQLVRLS